MFGKNKYIHPNPHSELIFKSEAEVRAILTKDEADAFLAPAPHPELDGYSLCNAGSDGRPVRVRILKGTIHEPDGTPHKEGDVMIMPKYVAEPWIEEKRIEYI